METPRKNMKAFSKEADLSDLMQVDGPTTEMTMCNTTEQKHKFALSNIKDYAPMRDFFDDDEDMPSSPVASKRFAYLESADFFNAPSKNFDNRDCYDASPCDFDLDGKLFDTEDDSELTTPRTPEKRPLAFNQAPAEKPKVQLSYADVVLVEFDLTKKLFFEDSE